MIEISIQELKKNGEIFSQEHNRSRDVLSKANGKRDYKEISKLLKIHHTTVSHLLSLASKLKLAEKNESGVYKKCTGVMSHIPIINQNKNHKPDISKIVNRGKRKAKITADDIKLQSSRPFKNLTGMTQGYQNLYLAENTLRELIRKVLGKRTSDWWDDSHVNKKIRDDVSDAIKNSPYDGYARHDELEYTHLGQLKEIITSKRNWPKFKNHLHEKNKSSFISIVDKAIPSRNAISHCIPLKAKDLRYVEMRFQDIIKMLK